VFLTATQEQVRGVSEELNKLVPTFFAHNLYENIADLVQGALGQGESFGANAYFRLLDVLSFLSQENKVWPDFSPKQPMDFACPTKDSLIELVRNTTREAYGDSLNKAYLINSFANLALNANLDNRVSVFIIPNLTKEEVGILAEMVFPDQPSIKFSFTKSENNYKSLASKIYHKLSQVYFNSLKEQK
jgi:hypothetical protein